MDPGPITRKAPGRDPFEPSSIRGCASRPLSVRTSNRCAAPNGSSMPSDRSAGPGRFSTISAATASGIDGVGAQSIFVLAREGRRRAIGCLLIKAEVGVRDAWARHGLTRAEMEEFVGQVAGGTEVFPVSAEYAQIAAPHGLAVNLASGIMPP